MEKFIIAKDIVKKVKRFNLTGRTIEFKIKPVPQNEEPVSWIKEAVNQVIQKGTQDLEPDDQVAFSFCSKDFARGDGWVRFRAAGEVSTDDVWNVISSVYQSNSVGLNTDTFCLGVTSVKMPSGKGNDNRTRHFNTFNQECTMRRGIIVINNKDNLCLPRALAVAIARAEKDPEYTKVRRDVGKLQFQRAVKLVEGAGVSISEEGCGIFELQKFQDHLLHYRIVVYAYDSKGRDVIFKGTNESPAINLLYHKGHYNVIASLTAAFACSYFCEECLVPYNTKNAHRCCKTCPCCYQAPICSQTVNVLCGDCKRSFRGQNCYDNHLKPLSHGKSTICAQIIRCEDCLKTLKRDRKHVCNEMYCKICQAHVPLDHLCFMQPDTRKPKTDETLFVFYDLETRQEKVLADGSLLHEPNLCVFSSRCDACINEKKLYFCQKCGYRLIVYREDVITNFMNYLAEIRKKFKHVIVIAHNGQSFDHQFILNHILINTDLTPELIMRGTKIISMKIGNMKFLDSLNYFPMALAKLPKAFGLGDTFRKGYFPHLFNTIENSDYIGPLPPIEFYSPHTMKQEERDSFLQWYEVHRNDEFDMKRDLTEYCISDVEILTAACLKFREQLLETGNVCPFSEACCTIASACNKVFRRNFLKPNTIGIIPKGGYTWRDNQSKIAIQWLTWLESTRKINILHAAKGKEAVVQGVKVDGFCPERREIFEFHGCYFHGCQKCFRHGRDAPLQDNPGETMNSRRESTSVKTERLKDFGYTVVEMWECEFRKMLKDDEELKAFAKHHELFNFSPLDPRDCFYGGRTGNTVEYYKCKPGEKIKYIDICSLYPWVCKTGKFPLGHPTVYVDKQCDPVDLTETNGVIKCKILPPRKLYHPLLPTKMNNKLMFVLCRTCGETMNQQECTHSDEQRALTGTWVIDEINKALVLGYEMMKIHEIWSYQVDQYNPATRSGGMFTAMMNRFIKLKQQASGWPNNCSTREQKDRYIEEFLEREDVQLEFSEITENPGLRSLAKLILNSFWGKLGQRENQPRTKIVRNPDELYSMLIDPGIYINAMLPINDDTLVVNYEYRVEAYDILSTVNVLIAAYVTTQARLKLYSYLERLGNRALYYDTDSVIYVSKKGDYEPETGNFIGDMTDELDVYGADSYITEFVSGGPKNYAYKVFSTRDNKEMVVCKVKGISLNYETSQLINFDSIKDMVLRPAEPLPIVSKNIRRTTEHKVVTVTQTKMYKPNSLKRKFLEDHSSRPYGYKTMCK